MPIEFASANNNAIDLMHSTTKNYYWRIAGFYFFYYAFVGMFAPYWSLYLKSIQLSAIEIATLMSIGPVMRMVAPNIWGWLADRTGKRLLVVQAAATLSALCYLGVFATTSFWGMFAVLALIVCEVTKARFALMVWTLDE